MIDNETASCDSAEKESDRPEDARRVTGLDHRETAHHAHKST